MTKSNKKTTKKSNKKTTKKELTLGDALKQKPSKKAKKEEPTKEVKTKAPKPTLEDMNKSKEANQVHVGQLCEFVPMLGDKPIKGGIRGLMCDKRVCLVYFRIQTEDGQVYHKRVDSDEVKVLDELAPKTKLELERKEQRAKAKIEKLEAKIEKAKTNIKDWEVELKELKA